jgi:hypothetical protein
MLHRPRYLQLPAINLHASLQLYITPASCHRLGPSSAPVPAAAYCLSPPPSRCFSQPPARCLSPPPLPTAFPGEAVSISRPAGTTAPPPPSLVEGGPEHDQASRTAAPPQRRLVDPPSAGEESRTGERFVGSGEGCYVL